MTACEIPPSTILADISAFVDNESLSDITFLIEGVQVHAHRLMLMRCAYFRAMLEGGFKESTEQRVIELSEVRREVRRELWTSKSAKETKWRAK